jgi:enoyl-CoA hydratase/carnithine racemase
LGAADLIGAAGGAIIVELDLESAAATPDLGSLPLLVIGDARKRGLPSDLADVVVTEDGDLDAIVATFERSPQAAISLAVLLRGSGSRSTEEGLAAESAVYSTLQSGGEFARWLVSRSREPDRPGSRATVRLARSGDTLSITLNRPEVHNALNAMMRHELVDALSIAAAPEITDVDLRGEGPSFCSGGDLAEFGSFADPATAHLVRLAQHPARALAAVAAKATVHVHGACMGAGIELAAFANRVVADRSTLIALPELKLGLIPGAGGTVSLPRRIGRHRAAWLALTGSSIDAATARDWGLVDEVTQQGSAR